VYVGRRGAIVADAAVDDPAGAEFGVTAQPDVNPYRRPSVIWRIVMRMSLSSSPVCGRYRDE
jgi:hypothetical protein